MFTRPTTDQILRAVADDLATVVLPDLTGEPVKVAVQMMIQLLAGCAVRAAHETAWMAEEGAAIEAAVGGLDDPATRTALAAYRAAGTDLHLEAAAARYDQAGEALGAAVEYAYRSGDAVLAGRLRQLLAVRSGHEMAIVGALELVGRG